MTKRTCDHSDSKSDTDVARNNFDVHQPILIIFGRNVADEVSYKNYALFSYLI